MTNVAELQVELIGATMIGQEIVEATDGAWEPHDEDSHADALAEFAGRACYQSWDRPNPKTATNQGYLDHILEIHHESVIEHGTASFYIQGVSRSLTHELVRHRHFSYSQLSQRYVDEADARYVVPPAARGDEALLEELDVAWECALFSYVALMEHLTEKGLPRKEARQTARSVLPNMTETKIVVSGNHRSWREFLLKRGSAAADTEIRELAVAIYDTLSSLAPNIYQDIHKIEQVTPRGPITLLYQKERA